MGRARRVLRFFDTWKHDPQRRRKRYRCPVCAQVIQDTTDGIVMEQLEHRTRGYHRPCWDQTVDQPGTPAYRAEQRAQNHLSPTG